jgi:hypothetical protein
MGYTTEELSLFIPPSDILKTAGTWTPAVNTNVPSEARGAADASFTLIIPVPALASPNYRAGSKLKSIDLFYKIATAAADDVATVELEKVTLPASGTAVTGAAVTVTLDAGHDTAAERKAVADHTLTVTLDEPAWIDHGEAFILTVVVDAAATTVFTLFGARANLTLRV